MIFICVLSFLFYLFLHRHHIMDTVQPIIPSNQLRNSLFMGLLQFISSLDIYFKKLQVSNNKVDGHIVSFVFLLSFFLFFFFFSFLFLIFLSIYFYPFSFFFFPLSSFFFSFSSLHFLGHYVS